MIRSRTKTRYGYRARSPSLQRIPITRVEWSKYIFEFLGGSGHATETTRCPELRYRGIDSRDWDTVFGDQHRTSRLMDAVQNGQTACFEFRNRKSLHFKILLWSKTIVNTESAINDRAHPASVTAIRPELHQRAPHCSGPAVRDGARITNAAEHCPHRLRFQALTILSRPVVILRVALRVSMINGALATTIS